jgi:hypothetical protein
MTEVPWLSGGPTLPKDIKLYLGLFLLVFSFLLPFAGFWVSSLPLPIAVKGLIIGLMSVGGPEVVAILSVALLGKQTFDLITGKMVGALGRLAPHGSVSRLRYKIGLVLFILPMIPTYIMGYAPQFLPDALPSRLYVNIASDLMFVTSLFVLGGDFWDKLRSLFVYNARAQFPD